MVNCENSNKSIYVRGDKMRLSQDIRNKKIIVSE